MLRRTAVAALFALLITAPRPAHAQDQTFERSFAVPGDAALDATTDAGDITVRAGSGSAIEVRGRVQVRRGSNVPSNAAELAARVASAPPLTQDGNTVRLGRIDDETTRRAVTISYEVSVPARTAVSARSGSGDVAIEGAQLAVQARTGSGDITVRALGRDADVSSGSGDLLIEKVAGRARAETGSGDIRASGLGSGLQARSGSGDIDAALDGKGDVATSTGSGSIRLAGVAGGMTASSGSGDVDVSGTPAGSWKVSTASGSVAVRVPEAAGFTLDASTSSGSFDVDVPLTAQGRTDRRRVQGIVRGGGPTIELSTASGSISVR